MLKYFSFLKKLYMKETQYYCFFDRHWLSWTPAAHHGGHWSRRREGQRFKTVVSTWRIMCWFRTLHTSPFPACVSSQRVCLCCCMCRMERNSLRLLRSRVQLLWLCWFDHRRSDQIRSNQIKSIHSLLLVVAFTMLFYNRNLTVYFSFRLSHIRVKMIWNGQRKFSHHFRSVTKMKKLEMKYDR
jgi:hypothetical protein